MRIEQLAFGVILHLILGCSQNMDSGSSLQSSFSFSEEPSFCGTVTAVSNPVVVTARAQFQARQVTASGLGAPSGNQDIKFAEVEVLTSGGARIQCGTTDISGQISIQIPRVAGSYLLRVYSRAEGSFYNASVLNNPGANLPYSIQSAFNVAPLTTSVTVALPIAPFNSSLEGGAFNILEQVYLANKFIRENSSCPSQGNVCNSFSVAPKARIYWTAGLSPYSYYGYPSSALSFFAREDDPSARMRAGIYIQGGIQGDVNCSDTDHFDNSVILHEYGHFLESAYSKSNSPGGSHNGNSVIDPRLAWSEGWANFFQTAVQGSIYYRDTIGNSSCSGGTFLAINLNMETPQSGQDRMTAGTESGEGLFREVSVARALYDTMDAGGSDGGAGVGFPFIWKIFSDNTIGLKSDSFQFRNMGLFNQYMKSLIASWWPAKASTYDSALSSEYQLSTTREYGLPVNRSVGSTCSFHIQGVADTFSMGSYNSHLLKSNDFFQYFHDGSVSQLQLHYSGTSPSDLNLYIYNEDYVFDDTSTMATFSARPYPESGGSGLEVVNLSTLPIGFYLINVRVDTSRLGQVANYYLSDSSGVRICP